MTIHNIRSHNLKVAQPSLVSQGLTLVGKAACVVIILSVISACGSRKLVVTSDDSVEYRTARSLPPLVKPTQGAVKRTEPVVSEVVKEPVIEPITEPVVETVSIQSAPVAVEPTPNEAEPVSAETNINAVLSTKTNSSRLLIESDWDGAWVYLTEKLKESDLTVFSRNKTAGRIAIGCSDVGDEVTEVKTGGWSIFNRKTARASEYCSLQLSKKSGKIQVSVLDRVGVEAVTEKARLVLEQLQAE